MKLGNPAPESAIAGMYDAENGHWTGDWYYTGEQAKAAAEELYKMSLSGEDDDVYVAESHHVEYDDGRIIDHMTGGEWFPA